MTHITTVVAPAINDTSSLEPEILFLDSDVVALIAEIDAILCAAPTPARVLPAPSVSGCALAGPRSTGRSCDTPGRARRGPVSAVFAVQRSPPNKTTPQPRSTPPRFKGR